MTKKKILIAVTVIGVISIIFFIAGIVFFVHGGRKSESKSSATSSCDYSNEAKRIGLDGLLKKVQDAYYEQYPDMYYNRPGATAKDVKQYYKALDLSPVKIKERTDLARKLFNEIGNIKLDVNKLKQREKKAFSQMKFFLKYAFSTGYDSDYYIGDWMMGPDNFCYKPICFICYEIDSNLYHFKPSTMKDMEIFRDKLIDLNNTFARYIENLKLGIQAGMVRPMEACKAGIFRDYYVERILSPSFLSKINDDIQELLLWRQKYKKPVNESLREFVLQFLGKPIDRLFKFLKGEYKSHCVPSTVSSGFSSLPLPYVYVNGTPNVSQPTTGKLPTGERLNGSKAYEYIMSYFTTNDMTPDDVFHIGNDTLHNLYPQTMTKLDASIVSMFYYTGNKRTTPSCPASLQPDFNPENGAQSYMRSDAECSYSAAYNIPFFKERPGPRYEEWSVNAHEVMPGHHLQDQGNVENFMDSCGGNVGWIQTATMDSYTAFVEGWGLYAENPLVSQGTKIYDNEPFYKYGMLKWQIWRALRLIVDTGLHYRNMTRAEAIKMFNDYAWAKGDSVAKEVTRYQSNAGQAVSYMIGRRHLMKIRAYAEKQLGSKFNLKDFHYQVLSQGTAPLSYLEDHIKKYVSCVKKASDDCKVLLNPTPKTKASKIAKAGARKDVISPSIRPRGKPPIRRYL
ncbi:hypothetical protein QZH41_008800 [Actinostola sp. cb2023]|nr:hypothetical protein QZH41_008800 [Actinostola sp. cb2023]